MMHTAIDLSLNPNSQMKLEQCFHASPSGRWMGSGSGNLQRSKLARKIILAGHYSYDIECSTHSVMLGLAERDGLELQHLKLYVDNKSRVRKELARASGVDIAAIKNALIAKSRGATDRGETMRGWLGDRLESLLSNEEWQLLSEDMSQAFNHIVDTAPKTSNRSHTVNPNGDRKAMIVEGRRIKPTQIVSHIYTGIESLALAAMTETINSPVLPIHDCLISAEQVDIQTLESAIEERTGLVLKIDEEQYPEWSQ